MNKSDKRGRTVNKSEDKQEKTSKLTKKHIIGKQHRCFGG